MNSPQDQPRYEFSEKLGLMRTDLTPPGYGRLTDPTRVIHLAAGRAALREGNKK